MSIPVQQRSILQSVEEYSRLLEEISEEDFLLTPEEGVWSYSEVYSHIFRANLASLIAAEQCVNGTAKKVSEGSQWMVRLILFFGRFPPGNYKVPTSIADMTVKMSREDARNLIIKFKSRLAGISSRISKASNYHKVEHPRLGFFNARQWFRFIEIHTFHHQKQLGRIRNMLANRNKLHSGNVFNNN